jgi:hypothetical protein
MAGLVGVSLATPAPPREGVEGEVEGVADSWSYKYRGTSQVQAVDVNVVVVNRTSQPTRAACRVQIFQADGRQIGEGVVETTDEVQPAQPEKETPETESLVIEIEGPEAVIGGEDDGVVVDIESCWEIED